METTVKLYVKMPKDEKYEEFPFANDEERKSFIESSEGSGCKIVHPDNINEINKFIDEYDDFIITPDDIKEEIKELMLEEYEEVVIEFNNAEIEVLDRATEFLKKKFKSVKRDDDHDAIIVRNI